MKSEDDAPNDVASKNVTSNHVASTISLPGKVNNTTLHTDGLFMLFELLEPVTSTCLGLTCKEFWAVHKAFHKKPLSIDSSSYYFGPGPKLYELLGNWMGTGMEYV